MTGQVLGYVRVSSTDQNPARQIEAIGEVEETFTDHVSGGSRATRTALATMLRHARRGDTVRMASMDRLARSVVDLAAIVTELTGRGVRVELVAERLFFDPSGEDAFATFQLHLLGAVAQLERSLVRERQREGIAIPKAKGVYQGRARKLMPEQVAEAVRLAGAGGPKAKIVRDLGRPRRLRAAHAARRCAGCGWWGRSMTSKPTTMLRACPLPPIPRRALPWTAPSCSVAVGRASRRRAHPSFSARAYPRSSSTFTSGHRRSIPWTAEAWFVVQQELASSTVRSPSPRVALSRPTSGTPHRRGSSWNRRSRYGRGVAHR